MSDYGVMSKLKARSVDARPFLVGAIVGGAATVLLGFTSGSVVMQGTVSQEVAKARVSTMASVCAQQAALHWTSQGKELQALSGWSNDDRKDLARRFTPVLGDSPTEEIVSMCSTMLKPA